MDDLSELMGQHGLTSYGNYMDRPMNGPNFNESSLGMLLAKKKQEEYLQMLRLKQQALMLKLQNPHLPDHEIGRRAEEQQLDIGLNDTLFNRALQNSQLKMKNPYYGTY